MTKRIGLFRPVQARKPTKPSVQIKAMLVSALLQQDKEPPPPPPLTLYRIRSADGYLLRDADNKIIWVRG